MSDTAPEAPAEVVPDVPVEVPAQETDWKAEARKWESRAKENLAKATVNSEAASKLAVIEDAAKTEVQRAGDLLAAAIKRGDDLEKAANESASVALIATVASAKGVPVELLKGSTKEELEASADALLAYGGTKKPTSEALSRVNTPSGSGDGEMRGFARSLFGRTN